MGVFFFGPANYYDHPVQLKRYDSLPLCVRADQTVCLRRDSWLQLKTWSTLTGCQQEFVFAHKWD